MTEGRRPHRAAAAPHPRWPIDPHLYVGRLKVIQGTLSPIRLATKLNRFVEGRFRSFQKSPDVDRGHFLLGRNDVERPRFIFRRKKPGQLSTDAKKILQGVLVLETA